MAPLELKMFNQKNKQPLQLGSKYEILFTDLNFASELRTHEKQRKS